MMSMMCNRVQYLCGCAVWLELEGAAWVSMSYQCMDHIGTPGRTGDEAA